MIKDKTAKIGVVGLGYVGLPLAVAFAEAGFNVVGIDVDKERIKQINSGNSYLLDIESSRLSKVVSGKLLRATNGNVAISQVDIVIICVPTPLTKTKEPDLSYIVDATKGVASHIHIGQLIILESTTYPGTTREVVLPILEATGLKVGVHYFLVFSPERIDPGNFKYTIKNTPKVVGGMDAHSTDLAALLYGHVSEQVIKVATPEVAEMDKVFENVFRSVNIALVNELAKLCGKMHINVWEVIRAASSKPFGYMPFYPGAGVGGHCIPLDPYYLSSKAKQYLFHTRFIELAAEINESMPEYVVEQVTAMLNTQSKSIKGAKIFILGVAYKKDIGDIRESPAIEVIKILKEKEANIYYNDPFVPELDGMKSVSLNNLSQYDCVVVLTPHSSYDFKSITKESLVFDTCGCTVGLEGNITRLGE